jgi:branched-chain amino acid transport system permease protein
MPTARTGPSFLWLLAGGLPVVIVLAVLPSFISVYQTQQLTYGLAFAIAALGFNLLLGYTGLLSFGHSAYFGAGAYTVAFIARDLHVHSMELCILGSALSALLVSALFGYACVRHTRIFFGILTLALSQVLYSLALKFFWVTGGTDGFRVSWNGLTLLGGLIDFKGSGAYQRFIFSYYYYVLGLFVLAVLTMWVIVHSPFGKALQAIRDNETRAGFVGIRVRRYRWIAFIISGLFTGVAGALWVPLNGLTTPEILYWPFSGEIVFMTVLGGFRTFIGSMVGALSFNYLKVYAVASSQYWQLVLGSVLVAIVLVLPSGIVGSFSQPPSWVSRAAASRGLFARASLALLLLLYLFIGTSEFAQSIGLSGDTAGIVGTLALMAAILSNFLLLVLIYHRGIAIGHVWLVALALLPALTFLISRVLGSAALFTFAAIGASLFLIPIVLGASLPSRKLAEHGA